MPTHDPLVESVTEPAADAPTDTPTDLQASPPTDLPASPPTDLPASPPTDLPASPPTDLPASPPTPVDSVLLALMSIGRLMRQRVDGDTLDPGSTWLLKNLHSRGSMRISELAGCVNLDASTVSRHVAQLQTLGLVERAVDPEDGRASRLGITADGQVRLEQAFDRRRALLAGRVQDWPADDLDQLARLLHRFVTDIDPNHHDLETP